MKKTFDIPHCETCNPRLTSIFGGLSLEEIGDLALHKGCNFHKFGQVLFYEGDSPSGLYCMNTGKVKLSGMSDDGKEQIVRLVKSGDVIGHRALISGEPYALSATVLEDATICFIPKSTFYKLFKDNPSISAHVMQLLCHELHSAEQKQLSLSRKPIRERLAETLMMIKEFYGCEDDGATLRGNIKREDLANIAGTAAETVIRLLSEFKKEQIIELSGKKIKILDPQKLLRIAHVAD